MMAMGETNVKERGDTAHIDHGAHNLEMVRKGLAAYDAGDDETMAECVSGLHMSADDLLYFKRVLGSDCFEEFNIDTTVAEEKYGRDWLDKEI